MSDDTLFREVDEEVRQEQYKKLWQRYGNYFIAVCVLVVVGVAGYKAYEYYQQKDAESASVLYFDGMREAIAGQSEEAMKNFDLVKNGGYGQLSQLQATNLLAYQGKNDEAIKAYQAIADDQALDVMLRDVAQIRLGYLQVDLLPPDTLKANLAAYITDSSSWRSQAREIVALSAYRTGDYAQAADYLNQIMADNEAPPGLKQRAEVLVQLVTSKLQN